MLNKECVAIVRDSDPYKKWALVYTVDDQKLDRRMAGDHTTEPSSLFGAGLARIIIAPPLTDLTVHVQTVMRSKTYSDWAAFKTAAGAYPHKTDHNKLVNTIAGKTTTKPGSKLALGLWYALKQPTKKPDDPPPPPPPGSPVWPPDKGTLAAPWQRDVVFVRALSSFHGDLRDEARAHGWGTLCIQLDNVYYAVDNEAELALIRGNLEAHGWLIGGWATYGQGADSPFTEGVRHSQIVKRLGLKCWIANGEAWAEVNDIWKSNAWIDGWLSDGGGGGVPVASSCLSSNTPDWAREFDYQCFIDRLPGSAIMPQTYGASFSSYTVHNALETLKRGHVPKNRVSLTFDVIAGQGPFPDYRTWDGPRGMYCGEDARTGTFVAFG